MRVVAIDTETFLIGPGSVVPKLVCVSFSDMKGDELLSHCDEGLEDKLRDLFTPGNGVLLVFHNASFDVTVLMQAFPNLEPLMWSKLEAMECSDTMLREQLLNLSTSGKLDMLEMPDGSTLRISYTLASLVKKYTGEDIEESKKGADTWRMNYDKLHGLSASQYPPAAREYAMEDGRYTIQCYYCQEDKVETEDGYASCSVDRFQTAVSVALMWITEAGMATDEAEFVKLNRKIEDDLSDDKMMPLIEAGIMTPAQPPLPYANKDKAARALVSEWLGIQPEDVDWVKIDQGIRIALEDSGVKFKAEQKSKIATKELKRRVLATILRGSGESQTDHLSVEQMEELAERREIPVVRTETGQISTSAEVIAELVDRDPVIAVYQDRQKLQKLVSTEIPRMMWDGKLSPVVHFPYRTLLETGRTSSYASNLYPSANGQNVDPRARPVFRARDGYLLCSCDYSMLELVCVAQTTYDLFGFSVHRDKANAGYDLHAYLGGRLGSFLSPDLIEKFAGQQDPDAIYSAFRELEGESKWEPFYKKFRKLAKPVGLGFPSGLGPYKMVGLAKKDPYNIDFEAMALERFETHPEEFRIEDVLFYAKKLFGMKKDNATWNPMLLAIAFAKNLREIWLETYPEMQKYFNWVRDQKDQRDQTIKKPTEDDPEAESDALCYTTPMGMHRARCSYTAVSNGKCMQSPGGEGFKWAALHAVRATRDRALGHPLFGKARVVNEVHDELLVELKEDEAHALAYDLAKSMEGSMSKVITDVKVKAQPCLMRNWHKEAEPVFDENERLVPWEDRVAKVNNVWYSYKP